jgi:SAM-dependent methyltransferase
MRWLDRVLQRQRIQQARRFVPERARVIDIGAFHGELFRALGGRLAEGWGVEPLLTQRIQEASFAIEPGFFPNRRPPTADWDAVTMLAVLEHIPEAEQAALIAACHELLRDDGRVIITVPSPRVDQILTVLRGLRLIDGMSLEEHHGFKPEDTCALFSPPRFRLIAHKKFQLGLNHLFVFAKERAESSS